MSHTIDAPSIAYAPRHPVRVLRNEMQDAHNAAVMKLANLKAPRITTDPAPGDFADVAAYAEEVLAIANELLFEAASISASCCGARKFDTTQFEQGVLLGSMHDALREFHAADDAISDAPPIGRWASWED